MLNLKQDFLKKLSYLKFIRISSKFINICACSHKVCHSYCITAFVLRKQQIYCMDCLNYYRLYVCNEQLFTGLKQTNMLSVLMLMIFWGLVCVGVLMIDRYMKIEAITDTIRQA